MSGCPPDLERTGNSALEQAARLLDAYEAKENLLVHFGPKNVTSAHRKRAQKARTLAAEIRSLIDVTIGE